MLQADLPMRWVQREMQDEQGLSAKKRWILQMKVFVISQRPKLVTAGGEEVEKNEQVWVDIPFVKDENG